MSRIRRFLPCWTLKLRVPVLMATTVVLIAFIYQAAPSWSHHRIEPNTNTVSSTSGSGDLQLDVACSVPGGISQGVGEGRFTIRNLSDKYYRIRIRTELICLPDVGQLDICMCDKGFYDWYDVTEHSCNEISSHNGNVSPIDLKSYPRQQIPGGECIQEGDWVWCTRELAPDDGDPTQGPDQWSIGPPMPLNTCCDCDLVSKNMSCGQVEALAVKESANEPWEPLDDAFYSPPVVECRTSAEGHDLGDPSISCFEPLTYFCPDASASIDTKPSNPSNDPTPSFTFSSARGGQEFDCEVDGVLHSPCPSPFTESLIDGDHRFDIWAPDVYNPTREVYEWTVDTDDPETTIVTAPSDPSQEPTAIFTFSSDEADAWFQCDLDGNGFTLCPTTFHTGLIANGEHTLTVQAIDAAGNEDATPASYTWSVAVDTCGLPEDGQIHIPYYYTGDEIVTPPGLGDSIFDLNYRCPIRRITDGPAGPGESLRANHHYATVSPFNKDGALILVEKPSPVGNYIVDRSGHVARSGFNVFPWMEPRWSPSDPFLLYYHSNPVWTLDPDMEIFLNTIYKYDVLNDTSYLWLEFGDYWRINFGQKNGGTPNGETDVSPNGMIVIGGNQEQDLNAPFTKFRIVDLVNQVMGEEIYGGPTVGILDQPDVNVDWCAPTPLSDNIICLFDRNVGSVFHHFELFKGFAGTYRGVHYESGEYITTVFDLFTAHADRGVDIADTDGDGQLDEIIVVVNNATPPSGTDGCQPPGVEKIRIPDGLRTCLLEDTGHDVHVSVNSAVDAMGQPAHGWALVSTYSSGNGTQDLDLDPGWEQNWSTHSNELILVNLDGSDAHRLVHHRKRQDPEDESPPDPTNNCTTEKRCIPGGTPDCGIHTDRVQGGFPLAALNGDARYAIFNSNFALNPFVEPPLNFPCKPYDDAYLVSIRESCNDNGVCEEGENCKSCPNDCIGSPDCGNGLCEAGELEDCTSCPQDCREVGQTCCGPGTGEGDLCSESSQCNAGTWVCSDSPGFCCGDGVCSAEENSTTCSLDCTETTLCPGGIATEGSVVVFPQPTEIFLDTGGLVGDNLIGIPAFSPLNDSPNDPLNNGFQQLCDIFGLRGTQSTITQFDPKNGLVHTFVCDVGGLAPPFQPCQGVRIRPAGVTEPILGTIPVGKDPGALGVEGAWQYPVFGFGNGYGNHLFSVPLTIQSTGLQDLCDHLNLPDTVTTIDQILADVGVINSWTCGSGQLEVWQLRPGEAVQIRSLQTPGQQVSEGSVPID